MEVGNVLHDRVYREKGGEWRLEPIEEPVYEADHVRLLPVLNGCIFQGVEHCDFMHLRDQRQFSPPETPEAAKDSYGEAHEFDEGMFWELIEQMLNTDPKKRITPATALERPFITVTYLNLGISGHFVSTSVESEQSTI